MSDAQSALPLAELPIVAFAPIPAIVAAFDDEVAVDLQARLDFVGAATLLAIANHWDQGRLVSNRSLLPHELEVLGLLELIEGNAAKQVAFARRFVADWKKRVVDIAAARFHRKTPLDRIAKEFALSPLAEMVLLAVAAPTLRAELSRAYRILANDPSRPRCDQTLLEVLLAPLVADPVALPLLLANELDASAPLRRHGLILMGPGPRSFAELAIDPALSQLLANQLVRAGDQIDVVIRHADRDLHELFVPPTLVERVLQYVTATPANQTRIVVRGRTGVGRRTLLAALAARAGRAIGLIDTATIPRDVDDYPGTIRKLLLRARYRGLVPCISGLETVFASDDGSLRRDVSAVLDAHPGPLCVRLPGDAPVPIAPGYLNVEFPAISETDRTAIWRNAVERYALDRVDIDDLARRNRIGPGIINRVCEELAFKHIEPPEQGWQPLVEVSVSQHLQNRLGATATRVHRLASWADIVLPDDILDSLVELTARVRHRRLVFDEWGFDKTITTSRGITALFAGTPGTGKTMVAGVLARDLGLELYRVDVARITSKWIGETEKNLASLFDAAEDGQVMLLFDECDSLFAKRTEVKTSTDRHANMQVNYLLQRLDTFEGIAILTTNFGTSIDPAFKRRLSYRITFPFPDEEMRERLWRTMLPADTPVAAGIDFGAIARRFSMSGGYIRNAALRAAFFAAEDKAPLSQAHLERAIRAEFSAIGKLSDTGTLE